MIKIVIKRLPDVCHSYSDLYDGSEDFDSVVCDFRSVAPFFSDRKRRCRCVNSLNDVSVHFALLF